ncbi:MAG: hypothetical protein HOV80_37475 [Polyangiaceae bacterium]|nr:hypothetical protein [Polyangiaceae bacterium]
MRPKLSLAFLLIASAVGCTTAAGSDPVVEMRPQVSSGEAPREVSSKGPRTFAVGKFGFVETLGGRRVLLLSNDVDVAWGTGKPELLTKPEDSLRVARVAIASGELPESHRVGGLAVDLYDNGKRLGETTLGTLWIASMTFDFAEPRAPGDERPPTQELADDAWNNGTRWLVADLGPATPKEAGWARLSMLPAPEIASMTEADRALSDRVLALLRREDAFASAQETFEMHYASINQPKPSDRWEDQARTAVTTFTHGGEKYVYARLEAGEACSFNALIARLYRARGNELVPVDDLITQDEPQMLIDTDGDGRLEVLGSNTWGAGWMYLQELVGKEQRVLMNNDRPEHYCPC